MRNQEQIIGEIELLLAELKKTLGGGRDNKELRHHKAAGLVSKAEFSGLTGAIYALVEEGFFKEPREISEIQKKLKDEGVFKPTTAMMPSLMRLIKKKVLGRNKPTKGVYKYYQRKI